MDNQDIMIQNELIEEKIVEIEVEAEVEDKILYWPQLNDYFDIDRQYRQLMFIYEAAISQLEARLEILNREFQFSNDRNPIENVKSRIKSKSSIVEKLRKKGLPMTVSSLTNHVLDIAGVRIICPFISDVYQIAKMILQQRDVELLKIKDYIQEPKENGYRSLHLIVRVEVPFAERVRKVPVEIQIRTIAMNFWASTEHQLRYKKDRKFTGEMQMKLKHCADIMAEADREMQEIAGGLGEEY